MEHQELNIDCTRYETGLTKKYLTKKKYQRPDYSKIHALIPGTITKILVRPGQLVKRGETLLVLEAMKMQNDIRAVNDGKIKNIPISEGQLVAKGALLVELE